LVITLILNFQINTENTFLDSTHKWSHYTTIGDSWDVYTKRMLIKNTLAVSLWKSKGATPPAPSADAHGGDRLW